MNKEKFADLTQKIMALAEEHMDGLISFEEFKQKAAEKTASFIASEVIERNEKA